MSATIFQGDKVTAQKDAISLNGGPEFRTVASDPQLVAVNCPEGSIVEYNGQLYRKTDNGSSTNVVLLGTGAGGAGGVNFIENADAELNNTTGWATYADAAGVIPVDGTGGSANITFTNTTTTPLAGNRSFLFTKDAANRQGQGVAYTFSVDTAYRAKAISISFDYIVSSGTFTAGSSSASSDLIVYLYDITNSQLISPSNIKLFSNSSTVSDKFEAQFQTSATGASYRLILHCASTSASAYAVEIDNISVGPSEYVFGTPITDWVAYTPTGTWTTNATYTGAWRRVGDELECRARIVLSGAPGGTSSLTQISLPTGLVIDTNKLPGGTATLQRLGYGVANVTNDYPLLVFYQDTTSVRPIFYSYSGDGAGTDVVTAGITATSPATFASSDGIDIAFKVPIVGWSSSVQTSDRADTRVVALNISKNGSQAVASTAVTQVTGWTVVGDTHGSFSSDQYVVPVSGWYDISAQLYSTSVTANAEVTVYVYVNGADTGIRRALKINDTDNHVNVNRKVQLNAGDILTVRVSSSDSSYTVNPAGATFLSLARISGPSAIAASETIACYAHRNAVDQTGVNPNATAVQILMTSVAASNGAGFDTHGAFNTASSYFEAPAAGLYEVDLTLYFDTTNTLANTYFASINRGTSTYGASTEALRGQVVRLSDAGTLLGLSCTGTLRLSSGDRLFTAMTGAGNNSVSTLTMLGTVARSRFIVKRIGL
jgi:hypothetical protein